MALCFECVQNPEGTKIRKGMLVFCDVCRQIKKEGTIVPVDLTKNTIKDHEIAIAELTKDVKELKDIVRGLIEQQQGTDRLLLNHLKVGDVCPHTLR